MLKSLAFCRRSPWLLVVAQSSKSQWRIESMRKVSPTLCSSHNLETVLPAPTHTKWKVMSTQTCTQMLTTILFTIIKPWMHPRCPTMCGKSVVHPDYCLLLAHEKGRKKSWCTLFREQSQSDTAKYMIFNSKANR